MVSNNRFCLARFRWLEVISQGASAKRAQPIDIVLLEDGLQNCLLPLPLHHVLVATPASAGFDPGVIPPPLVLDIDLP